VTVSSNFSKESKQLLICVEDRFDFSLHKTFRDSYTQIEAKDINYILDLSDTQYMDSSALGMILLLKEYVDMHAGKLVIRKPNDTVNKILEIAQFHRLMTIEL